MRKFILGLVLFAGCGQTGPTKIEEVQNWNATGETMPVLHMQHEVGSYLIREFEYDGCQYVAFGSGNAITISHKGNCKRCSEQHSQPSPKEAITKALDER